jgi:hypothetical protein
MELLNYNDCEGILIKDQLIIDWIEAPVKPELTFVVYMDCKPLTKVQMRPSLFNTEEMGAVITPADLAQVDKIMDAVYTIELIHLESSEGMIMKDCIFIGCETACQVLDFLSKNLSSPVGIYFELLKHINKCDACNCDSACLLWEEIKKILNVTKPKPCGNCK